MRCLTQVFIGALALGTVAASPASAQNYNWTGLYVGGNAGRANTDYNQGWVFALGGPPTGPGTRVTPSLDEYAFGGQIGFNYQMGSIVVGVEAATSGVSGDGYTSRSATNGSTFTSELRMSNIVTVGGRLGWAPTNQWLLFAGGGFATTNVEQRVTSAAGVYQTDLSTSARHDGWYVGGGLEYALTPHLILGVEYQHVSLDREQHCRSARALAGTCLGAGDDSTSRIDADVDIIRARLSFKFGADPVRAEPLK